MIRVTICLTLMLWLTTTTAAQEFETEVYPSEDELLEALERGQIDSDLFLILQELYQLGVDSTNLYLLDLLPNGSYFRDQDWQNLSRLETQQTQSLRRQLRPGQTRFGWLRYRFQQHLEQEELSRWRTSGKLFLSRNLQVDFQLRREFSGSERFISRSISYNSPERKLRELVVGNFSRRFGLGTIFGYRGKLLDFSEQLDRESFLYPDYGGYNGIYGRALHGKFESKLLFSSNRDDVNTINSAGIMLKASRRGIAPSLTLGMTRVKSRSSGETVNDIKIGATIEHNYSSGTNDVEIVLQSGETNSFALVTEGTHHNPLYRISYALWNYGDKFADLTTGSKAGRITRAVQLDASEFSFSSRRAGQKGAMVKTRVQLSSAIDMENSLLLGHRNKDSLNFQLLSGLTRKFGDHSDIRIDYLHRLTKRSGELIDRSVRVESNNRLSNLRARYYIRYRWQDNVGSYYSLFANVEIDSKSGEWEVWANLGEISSSRGQLDYFYGYLTNRQHLANGISIDAKLSHRYRRTTVEKHLTTLSIEVETRW